MSLLISLDIETTCAQSCGGKCEHALDEHKNSISLIGLYYLTPSGPVARTFRDVTSLGHHLCSLAPYELVGHNLKFDLRNLYARGLDLSEQWAHDTQLMAACMLEKIDAKWLSWYEEERARRNAALPRGYSHRPGSLHTLKCLAPYFLGVEPFWENPANHDNEEYCLKDCEYTYRLFELFKAKMEREDTYDFYHKKLLPFTRMLLRSEQRGVLLDKVALEMAEKAASEAAKAAKDGLDVLWSEASRVYRNGLYTDLQCKYIDAGNAAISKLASPSEEKRIKIHQRYEALFQKAAEKLPKSLNLDSPAQLKWLLKDHLKLPITNFNGEESTGKIVLNKLAEGREDIKLFSEYRKQQKLATAFFPSYREMCAPDGAIHCSFNPTGTRTGRLSSSRPNLQQVPSALHKLFRARQGYKLITYDMSAIEPRLIAYYTADPNLYKIVASGADFHGHATKELFEQDWEIDSIKRHHPAERKMGKELDLSLFYGAGTGRIQQTSQKYSFPWTEGDCRRKLNRFKEYFEGVFRFRDEELGPTLSSGIPVTNLLGRQFRIDDPTEVHMKGLNTLIQSSASDLVLNSAYRMTKRFKEAGVDAVPLLFVHDEIVCEVREDKLEEAVAIIVDSMTNYELLTPLGPIPLLVEGKIADAWEK